MKRQLIWILLASSCLLTSSLAAGPKHCKAELDACLTEMGKQLKAKGWVGIELKHNDDGTLTVKRVIPNSPASEAGLRPNDRLLALNGVSYGAKQNRQALKEAYAAMKPDKTVTYTVERSGRQLEIDIRLAHLPEHIRAKWIAQHLVESHGHTAP